MVRTGLQAASQPCMTSFPLPAMLLVGDHCRLRRGGHHVHRSHALLHGRCTVICTRLSATFRSAAWAQLAPAEDTAGTLATDLQTCAPRQTLP